MAEGELRSVFLAERKLGIGGSDVAAIFGLDRYRTPDDLWMEKTGQLIPADEPSGDKERGIRLEPFAVELYRERAEANPDPEHGLIVAALEREPSPYVHRRFPWMRGNIDRRGIPEDGSENFVAEVKCPSLGMYSKIKREGLPASWVLQGQHYLIVTGLKKLVWIIFCADRWELVTFTQTLDADMAEMIINREREFWMLVETMTPPPPFVREVKGEEIVQVGTVIKRSDESFVDAAANLRQAKELKATAEAIEAEAKMRLEELAGGLGVFEAPGARFYIKEQAGRKTFDKTALASARPIDRQAAITALVTAMNIPAHAVEEILKDATLDLAKFDKQGKPFKTFLSYFFGD